MTKTVSAILLVLLFIGMPAPVFVIRSVNASGTIYIRADGSIEGTTDISTVDNVIYTFTNNINDEIVVERNNIVVDGEGYTVQGIGAVDSKGIYLFGISNVTIKNTNIEEFSVGNEGFHYGIYLETASYSVISGNTITAPYGVYLTKSSGNKIYGNEMRGGLVKSSTDYCVRLVDSDNNTVSGNTITKNWNGIYLGSSDNNTVTGNEITGNSADGVYLYSSKNNTVSGNNITTNNWNGIHLTGYHNNNTISANNIRSNKNGVYLSSASDNLFYHNNFVYNTLQVHGGDYANVDWDNGYPSGGNYWSDHVTVDDCCGVNQDEPGSDGIGDTPYAIDESNQDNYPLMNPWTPLEHELVASISAPASITLGGSSSLNATVTNQGSSDEVDVELLLFIDGTPVDSTTIPLLQVGNSYPLSYLWIPSIEGTYNITAHTPPLPEERNKENNQNTKFVTVAVSPPEAQVGVKAGDWIKLDYTVTGWPSGTPYPAWLKVEILSVEGTTATVWATMQMSDGTEQSDTVSVDVVAGSGTFGTLFGFVVPADCSTGDSIYLGGDSLTFNVTIDGETTRTYAGASRTVVYASFSQYGAELTYYWDKATGIMAEASTTSGGVTGTAKATETNMWAAAPSPFWMQWWLWVIVAVVIVALAGAVYFLRKRKPTPPLPPPQNVASSRSTDE